MSHTANFFYVYVIFLQCFYAVFFYCFYIIINIFLLYTNIDKQFDKSLHERVFVRRTHLQTDIMQHFFSFCNAGNSENYKGF